MACYSSNLSQQGMQAKKTVECGLTRVGCLALQNLTLEARAGLQTAT